MVIRLSFFALNRAVRNRVSHADGFDADEDGEPDDWSDGSLPDEDIGPDDDRLPWEDWDPLDDEPPEPAPGDFWLDDPDPDD